MAEVRRLLVDTSRLNSSIATDGILLLRPEETHYLKRVLRLRKGDALSVVDGYGHLWNATMHLDNSIELSTPFNSLDDQILIQNFLVLK